MGKTTLFNLLTGARVAVAKHSSGRSQPNVGVARVADARLDRLSSMFRPRKTTLATVEFLDIQGLEKGEAKGSLYLAEMRNVDAIAHVVRAFRDPEIVHSEGAVDPKRDIETMDTELVLADLDIVQRRLERLEGDRRKGKLSRDDEMELPILRRCLEALESGRAVRDLDPAPEDLRKLRGFAFLTAKPLLAVVNLDEADAGRLSGSAEAQGLGPYASRAHTGLCLISARVEEEIAALEPADARAFLDDLGVREPARERLIRAAFDLLGLIQFFTVGEDECRGWPVRAGTSAPRAAATIHSDLEKGFIRAEVVSYADLVEAGGLSAARARARVRSEGKDYVVHDGDVIEFRFNV